MREGAADGAEHAKKTPTRTPHHPPAGRKKEEKRKRKKKTNIKSRRIKNVP